MITRSNAENVTANPNLQKNANFADLNTVEANMKDHISKLNEKVIIIVSTVIANKISIWGAKPPVPSACFREISK